MSGNEAEDRRFFAVLESNDAEENSYDGSESPDEEGALSTEDYCLFAAVKRNDAAAVQQALRDGANVNAFHNGTNPLNRNPLMIACRHGFNDIASILLDAGADARWRDRLGNSAISMACYYGHLSTVQLLTNHHNGLLETVDNFGRTPLFRAINGQHSDLVRFLLDSGADPHHADRSGNTALMRACIKASLEIVRLLVAAGVDVEAVDRSQRTAMHYAAIKGRSETMRELILQHNVNMSAVDKDGRTPFDLVCVRRRSNAAVVDHLLETYGNRLTQDHGRLALHELLMVAEYSFAEERRFHPPLNPLQIILSLGKLRLKHLRTLLQTFDPELIRNRDDTGKLPFHIACQTNAPVEVLALLLELDPTTLHNADSSGALPIHLLCGNATEAAECGSVRYLVEQGGVGTLAARNRQGLMSLHILCRSTNPPLRVVQYLMQSFPGSVAMQSNVGQYQLMMAAAAEASSASLTVIYELVRANPGLVVPK